MHTEQMQTLAQARRDLGRLGFRGADVYFAELIPAVEMAWADGEIHPMERALLEAYCDALVEQLNVQADAPFFSVGRARVLLTRLLERRLTTIERAIALRALGAQAGAATQQAHVMRRRMLEWAEAVGAVSGSPVWDSRELFWLEELRAALQLH